MNTFLLFSAIFAITYYLLRNVLFSEYILTLGIGIVAWMLADLLTKVVINTVPKNKIDPTDKAVFVTGCDSGFGNELVIQLDKLGFYVYAGCLFANHPGAKKLKECCSDRVKIIEVDVTSDEQVKLAAKEVESTLDGKDLWAIVNNAGIATFTEIEWCPVETYHKIFDVNAMGPLRVTKAFLPLLRESQGRVVIMASLAGRYTYPGFSAYSMSKYAAVSFADALRREMKKWNISVHTVEPSLYKTPIMDNLHAILKNSWEATPTAIQESYGQEYFQAFQDRLVWQLNKARCDINEVVDDLVDAVAGQRPKTRYVPSFAIQFRAKVLSSIPTEMQDYVLGLAQPRCIPLGKTTSNNSVRPEYRRSRSEPAKSVSTRLFNR